MNLIHPGYITKARVFVLKLISKNLLQRKSHSYDTILNFFETIKHENVLLQRIIGGMPHEIHLVYLQEREIACNTDIVAHQYVESKPAAVTRSSGIDSTQARFFKEIIESGDEQYRNFKA